MSEPKGPHDDEFRSIEMSLAKEIAEPLVEIAADAGESLLDSLIVDGVLKETPFIGNLIRLGKAGFGVRDYLFVKKLLKFKSGYQSISDQERTEFQERLKDPKEQLRVGEAMTEIIDKLDDAEKARFLGLIYTGVIQGKLEFEDFRRISSALQRVQIGDLEFLPTIQARTHHKHSRTVHRSPQHAAREAMHPKPPTERLDIRVEALLSAGFLEIEIVSGDTVERLIPPAATPSIIRNLHLSRVGEIVVSMAGLYAPSYLGFTKS